MKTFFAVAAVLSVTAVAPTLADFATARSNLGRNLFLAEASGPSPGSRDTAVLAEAESNGPSRFGRDSAQVAEASGPSPGGRDSAQTA